MAGVEPRHQVLLDLLVVENLRVVSETWVDRLLQVHNRPVTPSVRGELYDRLAAALQQAFEQEVVGLKRDLGID